MTHFCNTTWVPQFAQSTCNETVTTANAPWGVGSIYAGNLWSKLPSVAEMRAVVDTKVELASNFTKTKAAQAGEFVSPYLPDLTNAQSQNMILAGLLVATFALSTFVLLKAATQEVSPEKSKAIVPVKAEKEEEIIEINTADFVKKPQPMIQQSPAWVVLIEIDSGTAAKVRDFIEDFNNFCISMMLL